MRGAERAPILVTGSHRCGSTWVGRVLASAPELGYLQEPFHPRHRPGMFPARFDRWFLYVTEANEQPYLEALAKTLAFRYHWRAELPALRSPRDLGRMFRDAARCASFRRRGARPLMKDPLALFSAPWLASRFGMDVVILTRHPAAFAWSLKRMDWQFDFENLLAQPLLMEEWLEPWVDRIRDAVRSKPDVIGQAGLFWAIAYDTVARFAERHPAWHLFRHEDLSTEPVERFQGLFQALGVTFCEASRLAVERSTSASNPVEAPEGTAHALARDSRANVKSWSRNLSASEVDQVRRAVEGVSERFYGEAEW